MKLSNIVIAGTLILVSPSLFANKKPGQGAKATESARENLKRSGRDAKPGSGKTAASRARSTRAKAPDAKALAARNKLAVETEFLNGKSEKQVVRFENALEMTGMKELRKENEKFIKSESGTSEVAREIYESVYELMMTVGAARGSKAEALVADFLTRHAPGMLKEFSEGNMNGSLKLSAFVKSLAAKTKGTSRITNEQLNESLKDAQITREAFEKLCGRG